MPVAGEPQNRALFRRFPQLEPRIPWLPLGSLPTPVERLQLARFGSGHWVKRDDLSGQLYGGNKVRKLEFVLAEARRQRAERLITVGAAGSHHALATAIYGRALGFAVTAVLFPQPFTPHVREVLLHHVALGTELRYSPRMETLPLSLLAAQFSHRRARCFTVAAGGSDPVGTLGYVGAALEFAEQVEAGACPAPARVHLPIGTMGTAVGLAIGFELAGLPIDIAAVRITGRLVTNPLALRRLVNQTLRLLGEAGVGVPAPEAVLRRIEVRHHCIGRGYGHATRDCRRAHELFAEETGLTLDPTYTAKAAVDFLDALERQPTKPHLFWHTLSSTGAEPPDVDAASSALPAPFRRYMRSSLSGT